MITPEKRKYKRTNCVCTVRIRPFYEGMDTGVLARWEVVPMQNLSASGILFVQTKTFPMGAMFEFNVTSPVVSGPVYCVGRVIRVEKRQNSKNGQAQMPAYSIAVNFKDFDEDKQESIKRICDAS